MAMTYIALLDHVSPTAVEIVMQYGSASVSKIFKCPNAIPRGILKIVRTWYIVNTAVIAGRRPL